jgi:hypothetical protein
MPNGMTPPFYLKFIFSKEEVAIAKAIVKGVKKQPNHKKHLLGLLFFATRCVYNFVKKFFIKNANRNKNK